MSMHIGGGLPTAATGQSTQQWQLRQQNVKALTSALQSGNLATAKAAYSSLIGATGKGRSTSANSALAEIGRALASGDLAAARRAVKAVPVSHPRPHHPTTRGAAAVSTSASPVSRVDTRA